MLRATFTFRRGAKPTSIALASIAHLLRHGDIDLASASDMVTDAMSALGMGVNEAETMVDQMAKTASSTLYHGLLYSGIDGNYLRMAQE